MEDANAPEIVEPLGTIVDSFSQVMEHLRDVNAKLRSEIADRSRAEEKLRRSEERLRDLFDNAIDLIQSISPDGTFLSVNRAWKEILGYDDDEIARLTIFDIIAPEYREHCSRVFPRVMAGENVGRVEVAFVAKGGRKITVEGYVNCRFEDGRPVATRSIFRDITLTRKLEEDLLRARKLKSIGVLAGGIAHDFNNLLSAVLGNLELAKLSAPRDGVVRRRVEEAETACLEGKRLTQQLLTFSLGGAPVRKKSLLPGLLKESAEMVLRGARSRCQYRFAQDLLPVEIDEGQMGQAVRDVVRNADEAMPDGGVIRVAAENVTIREGDGAPLSPGRYVKISVEDEGMGIPADILPRLFDPFFTTKATGTGLGLATAYSIVTRHGGEISVESALDAGTTVTIHLPALPAGAVPAPAGKGIPSPGMRRILVMDDEEMVRAVSSGLLGALGYQAECARDGAEAIEAYRAAGEEGNPFDAVIVDLTVPGGMGGKEAVCKLLELDPAVKAIVSSGYCDDPVMAEYERHGFCAVIAKPYRSRELKDVLAAVLG